LVKRGLPVRVQKVENGPRGPVYQVTELAAIRETPVADGYLETPAGYTRESARDVLAPPAHGALGGRDDAPAKAAPSRGTGDGPSASQKPAD